MPGSLLDELSPMGQDKSLSCCLGARLDSTNELGEDDLGRSARSFFLPEKGWRAGCTVLPLPVARETPNRLWPFSRDNSTDWMHSS
jgi:hypothetical protein